VGEEETAKEKSQRVTETRFCMSETRQSKAGETPTLKEERSARMHK